MQSRREGGARFQACHIGCLISLLCVVCVEHLLSRRRSPLLGTVSGLLGPYRGMQLLLHLLAQFVLGQHKVIRLTDQLRNDADTFGATFAEN